jgi:formylglycine-generating enzyme
MRSFRRAAVLVLVLPLLFTVPAAACQLVNGLDSVRFVEGGAGDARPDRVTAHDSGPDGPCVFDGHATATPMVPIRVFVEGGVTDFCIERTEVTFEQFTEFIQDASAPTTGLCPNHSVASFQSSATCETPPDSPATLVPWCGAYQYCAALHRSLCVRTASIAACHGASGAPYPYGDTFEAGRCNVSSSGPGPVPWNDGSCETGDSGVFDMIGNVAEWVNDCVVTDSGAIECAALGGGFEAGAAGCARRSQPVAPDDWRPATVRDPEIGFRCCYAGTDCNPL